MSLIPEPGKPATAAQKLRYHAVNDVVSAINTLILFDLAVGDEPDDLPDWYRDTVREADFGFNAIMDALRNEVDDKPQLDLEPILQRIAAEHGVDVDTAKRTLVQHLRRR